MQEHKLEVGSTDVEITEIIESDHPDLQKKELTKKDIGKIRKMYFTVKHSIVEECGHKYNDLQEPRNNCPHCWFAYLNTHGDMVKLADEAFHEQNGPELLAKLKGDKFVKMFVRFMSTIARWKAEADKLKGNDGEGNTGDNSSANESANESGFVQESEGLGEVIEHTTEDNNIISEVGQ